MNSTCPHQQPDGEGGFHCTGGKYDGKNVSAGVCRFCLDGTISTKNLTLPPITDQIKNITNAAGKVVKAAIHGQKILASEELVAERRKICENECELWMKEKHRCSKCGCYTSKKIKFETEHCPEKKW